MELSQKECSDGGTNCQQELHGIHPAILTYGVETERENVDRVRITETHVKEVKDNIKSKWSGSNCGLLKPE
jgi:hypothetical protein